jgi:hypothetical protein
MSNPTEVHYYSDDDTAVVVGYDSLVGATQQLWVDAADVSAGQDL